MSKPARALPPPVGKQRPRSEQTRLILFGTAGARRGRRRRRRRRARDPVDDAVGRPTRTSGRIRPQRTEIARPGRERRRLPPDHRAGRRADREQARLRGRAAEQPEPAAGRKPRTGLHPEDTAGSERQPLAVPRQGRAARVLRHLVPALQRRGTAPAQALRLPPEGDLRLRVGERGRRDRPERVRVPPLLRAPVPGPGRLELAARKLQRARAQPGRSPAPTTSSPTRPSTSRPARPDRLARRRRTARRAPESLTKAQHDPSPTRDRKDQR